VWALHEQGRDGSTVVAVVGDHGEAFEQHASNSAHGRYLYEENLHVPAVITGPGIVPGRVEAPTSHVDLLPTLLDALGRPWNPLKVQGESIFRESTRRQIFSIGSENALVAIDREGRKVLVSYHRDTCHAWDLAADPQEHEKLDCEGFTDLEQSLVDFHGFQTRALLGRDAASRAGRGLNPPRSPSP